MAETCDNGYVNDKLLKRETASSDKTVSIYILLDWKPHMESNVRVYMQLSSAAYSSSESDLNN